MSNKKVVVTGGEGFIGTHLCAALRGRGYRVEVVDLKNGKDVRNGDVLLRACKNADVVFHLAAVASVQRSIEHPEETHEHNLSGTLNVLLAAKRAGVRRVVFSSSAAVYGDPEILPTREDMPVHPKSPYALEKYVGERYCKLFSSLYELDTVSLRYFNVYGSGMNSKGAYAALVGAFLELRSVGKPLTITGDGTQTRDFVHVSDVVRANIDAAEHAGMLCGDVFNIGSGVQTSVRHMAELVGGDKVYVEPRVEPRDSCADISRVETVLRWKPTVRLEDGIAELKKLAGITGA